MRYPIIHNEHVAKLTESAAARCRSVRRPSRCAYSDPATDGPGLEYAMTELCRQASEAVAAGFDILILSDRGVNPRMAPIPSLLATAGVHHHLVRQGRGRSAGSSSSRATRAEVHHVLPCCSAMERASSTRTSRSRRSTTCSVQGMLSGIEREKAIQHYIKALNKGVLKVHVEDGDLDAAELLRRADLRSH